MDLMNEIIQVGDIQIIHGKGVVIGGALLIEDITPESYIGKTIRIINPDNSTIITTVLDVMINSSIIDKKNIFFLLSEDISDLIMIHAKVQLR